MAEKGFWANLGQSFTQGAADTDWWGALMSGVQSYSSNRQARSNDEAGIRAEGQEYRLNLGEQARQGRLNTEFEMGLSDYYKRKNQEDRRKGFSNFGQFATNQYAQPYTPAPVGPAPTAFSFEEQQRTLGGG